MRGKGKGCFAKRTAAVLTALFCIAALAAPVSADVRRAGSTAARSMVRQDILSSGSLVRAKRKSGSAAKPKKIPKGNLTGNPRKDALIIALSQVGYRETRKGGRQYSYYGSWASSSQASTGAPWCSEFAAWCIQQAGVPEELYPRFTSVYAARNFFGPLGRVFAVEGGNKHSAEWIGKKNYAGAIALTDIQRGDIILVRRHSTKKSSPSHTCMVRNVDAAEKVIYTVDGNVGGAPTKVMKRKLTVKHVYAVIKPFYELYPLKGLSAESVTEKDEEKYWFYHDPDEDDGDADGEDGEEVSDDPIIRVAWKDRVGVTGYRVLRADSPHGQYEQVKEIFDSAITTYFDEHVTAGETYYYKVVPFVETASGEIVDGSSYLEEAEKKDRKTWVKVLAGTEKPEIDTVSEPETDLETETIAGTETDTQSESEKSIERIEIHLGEETETEVTESEKETEKETRPAESETETVKTVIKQNR